MQKAELINKILNFNLDLCQTDTEVNDSFIADLLLYGFKGLENMTIEELENELNNLE
jgi:hypothetical protein